MGYTWILIAIVCLVHLRPSSAEIKLMQAMIRHGQRTPIDASVVYRTDPYINKTYPPVGVGGLTNFGKQSSYILGKFLRERYGEFLGPIYTQDIIRFRADEIERIVMTGQLVAAALFPPTEIQRWNPDIRWQPIPVWAPPLETDVLFNGIVCKNHRILRAYVEKNDKYLRRYNRENKDVYEYLSKHTGYNISSFSAFFLRQHLYSQRDIGLKLPKWTERVFPGILDDIALFDFTIQSYTNDLRKMLGGVWIREWLNHVADHLNETSTDKRKAYVYSVHELNIVPTLIALNVFDYQLPSYNSFILFELHEIENHFYIQMLHKNWDDLRILEIPGCGNRMCPLDVFKKIVAAVIPEDPVATCGGLDFNIF